MAATLDDRPQVDERYARATHASDLTPSSERFTDADVLLAAGYAARRNRNGMLALMAYRMKLTGDRACRGQVVDALIERLVRKTSRERTWSKRGGAQLPIIPRPRARVVTETVLNWWLDDNCEVCTGRLMKSVPGVARVLSDNRCEACAGTGKREIPDQGARFNAHRNWLAAELDRMLSFIFAEMARILSPRLDLKIEVEP